jgi:uncharacterized Fe-S cluster-containing radical SAM superfamily protein
MARCGLLRGWACTRCPDRGRTLARKDCDTLLALLHERHPQLDLRLTTNGTLLEPHIPLLRRTGVRAVNLSLDSFDRATFARVTGRDVLPAVLAALDALLRASIRVKINVVAMRGFNDGQRRFCPRCALPAVVCVSLSSSPWATAPFGGRKPSGADQIRAGPSAACA